MATAVFAEALESLQHSARHILEYLQDKSGCGDFLMINAQFHKRRIYTYVPVPSDTNLLNFLGWCPLSVNNTVKPCGGLPVLYVPRERQEV
jgi:hypothetical protein